MKISELQKDLISAFKWTSRLNNNERIVNHFTLCMQSSNNFYINGSGMHFSAIKARNLVSAKQSGIERIKKNLNLVDPTSINIHVVAHKKVPYAKHIHQNWKNYHSGLNELHLKSIRAILNKKKPIYKQ